MRNYLAIIALFTFASLCWPEPNPQAQSGDLVRIRVVDVVGDRATVRPEKIPLVGLKVPIGKWKPGDHLLCTQVSTEKSFEDHRDDFTVLDCGKYGQGEVEALWLGR